MLIFREVEAELSYSDENGDTTGESGSWIKPFRWNGDTTGESGDSENIKLA